MIKRERLIKVVTTVGVLGKLGIASASAALLQPPAPSVMELPGAGQFVQETYGNEAGASALRIAAVVRHGDDGGDDSDGDDSDGGDDGSHRANHAKPHGHDGDDSDGDGDD